MSWTRKAIEVAVGPGMYFAWQFDLGEADGRRGTEAAERTRSRFEFEIIESFDGKYLGDTPGPRPQRRARGDPAQRGPGRPGLPRGDPRVGTVTSVVWSRAKGSLDVEFDPEPLLRISVGEVVWIAIDGSAAPGRPE